MRDLTFKLEPLPPFRLDLTAWALRRRPVNEIDAWDGETYSRVLTLNGRPTLIEVRQSGTLNSPVLHVKTAGRQTSAEIKKQIIQALELLLGLWVDMKPFYRFSKTDPRLNSLRQRYLGLKPPRFPSVFEGLMNGIACQQLSLHVGLTLLNRLSAKSGFPFKTPDGIRYSFPTPEILRTVPTRTLRAIGFSANKVIAIRNISSSIHLGRFEPESLKDLNVGEAVARLTELKGIGRWTAEYVLLRGLGRTDLFPGDDVGARNNLRRWLKVNHALDYEGVNHLLRKWRPYAGLIYFHLLLDSLDRSGSLTVDPKNSRLARRRSTLNAHERVEPPERDSAKWADPPQGHLLQSLPFQHPQRERRLGQRR